MEHQVLPPKWIHLEFCSGKKKGHYFASCCFPDWEIFDLLPAFCKYSACIIGKESPRIPWGEMDRRLLQWIIRLWYVCVLGKFGKPVQTGKPVQWAGYNLLLILKRIQDMFLLHSRINFSEGWNSDVFQDSSSQSAQPRRNKAFIPLPLFRSRHWKKPICTWEHTMCSNHCLVSLCSQMVGLQVVSPFQEEGTLKANSCYDWWHPQCGHMQVQNGVSVPFNRRGHFGWYTFFPPSLTCWTSLFLKAEVTDLLHPVSLNP